MGCCSIIILIFLAIAVAFIYVTVALAIFDFVFLILAIASIVRAINASKMRPSKMICTNCNSKSVRLSTRQSGTDTNAYFFRFGLSMKDRINYQRIAECQNCGFVWNYYTKSDIQSERSKACGMLVLSTFLFLICMFFTMEMASI